MSRNPGHDGLPAIAVLGGWHELAVRGLTLEADSFSISYIVTPALPQSVLLTLDAEDDLGNTYVDWGGVYDTSPDRRRTQGTITARPAPPPTARHLQARLTFLRDGEAFPYDLSLDLS
ncbi:hypothetical protein OG594_16865 [Streptomyces sp. NBC_01214]|uniref:hypothetical protein n=1 Tax=Streptomyces sp. NBC_01214 TaxID=2903777 RepID=UPI00225BE748|nr:hypothetical protein [Streptomyces sp. NBC_01214]MCX4803302.1 hypothetical protein [Streptomyces sp. NBC_01214]